tara:strand:+ start:16394 stop:16900 length:507 start_codon:yes stop_codon:yes gene_type:complete
MRVSLESDHWMLDEIGDVEWFMLVQLPEAADFNQSEKGKKRILPDPTDDDEEVVADWKEFVQPEIETQFKENLRIVSEDLDQAEEIDHGGAQLHRIQVPVDHAETWYSVLNQARLILNEEHNIANAEYELFVGEQNPTELGEKRWLLMVQYRVYGAIQEFLLTNLMEG